MQDAVIKLYGPQAGGLISINNLSSYSFEDLSLMLDSPTDQADLIRDLGQAHWIIMVTLGDSDGVSSFEVMKRFLAERPDLFQQKRLIVFTLGAPYYLDATNISKLTAYYALYSKAAPFIDTAAYLLFGELRSTGAPPVSVPGIGYNLNEMLFPAPEVPIPLEFDLPAPQGVITGTTTPEPAPPPEFRVGDVVPLRAGVIYDHNGHPVPDGTPVNFVFSFGSEASSVRQLAYTQKGMARTTYAVPSTGTLEIIAESENARSESLKLDIPLPSGEVATPTATEFPTPTPTAAPPTPTLEPFVTPTETPIAEPEEPGFGEWLIAVSLSLGLSFAIYRFSTQIGNLRWGIRASFLALIGGLLAYLYLAIQLPGSQELLEFSLPWGIFLASLSGMGLGLVAAFIWRALATASRKGKSEKGRSSNASG
jgi:beta-N-acetylhexosaminidase